MEVYCVLCAGSKINVMTRYFRLKNRLLIINLADGIWCFIVSDFVIVTNLSKLQILVGSYLNVINRIVKFVHPNDEIFMAELDNNFAHRLSKNYGDFFNRGYS